MKQRSNTTSGIRKPRNRSAFTIIELLVVTAIIILLLSIVLVAMNAATKTSQQARTVALMDSIKKGLIRFKGDIGYYPPILGVPYQVNLPQGGGPPTSADLRRLFPNSVPSPFPAEYTGGGDYVEHIQEYFSTCTLADYLVGYGRHQDDGYGVAPGEDSIHDWDVESPPTGIRHPGPDGAWGSTLAGAGELSNRMKGRSGTNWVYGSETSPFPLDQGKVFAPYVELRDERLLAGVDYSSGQLQTFFRGDVPDATWESLPKSIVDYWGMPIRYYRRPYPRGALTQSYRAVFNPTTSQYEPPRIPRLSDVFVLRPQAIKAGAEVVGLPDDNGSTATTSQLDNAEFAILSAGADRRLNQNITVDAEGFNKDNIVEVGP